MSDRINISLAREVLGQSSRIFQFPDRGLSKSYLSSCLSDPTKLNFAFYWRYTIQGDEYWRECCARIIPQEEIEERLSILLPLIYEKTLTLDDLM